MGEKCARGSETSCHPESKALLEAVGQVTDTHEKAPIGQRSDHLSISKKIANKKQLKVMNYVYIHEIHSDVKKTQVLYRRADALF